MDNLRRKHTPTFKAKVALEAIKEQKTSAELTSLSPDHKKEAVNGLEAILNESKNKVVSLERDLDLKGKGFVFVIYMPTSHCT